MKMVNCVTNKCDVYSMAIKMCIMLGTTYDFINYKISLSYAVYNLMWLLGDSNVMIIDSTIGMCLYISMITIRIHKRLLIVSMCQVRSTSAAESKEIVGLKSNSYTAISLAWPDPIPLRGIIAFSISAPLRKGSGTVHSVHSVFTLSNVLQISKFHTLKNIKDRVCFVPVV